LNIRQPHAQDSATSPIPESDQNTLYYPILFLEDPFNTLWTGEADLRLYITTVQDG